MDLWNYFEKCHRDKSGQKRATCQVCLNTYSYTTTITNLKQHLSKKHNIEILPDHPNKKRTKIQPRRPNNPTWRYFTIQDKYQKIAKCIECEKNLSFKTTTTNLRIHLKLIHPELYEKVQEICENNYDENTTASDGEEFSQFKTEELEEDYESSDEEQKLRTSEDIGSYFEKETGGRARCAVCRLSVPNRDKALRDHLRANHPKLLPEGEQDQEFEHQEEYLDNDIYTEVVYLEEPKNRTPDVKANPIKRRRRSSYKEFTPRHRSPLRSSFHSSEKPKRSPEDEELETFGTYVTCLLKTLSKDECTAVQRDIINIIMNAKLRKTNQNNVVVESHHVTPVIMKTVPQNKEVTVIQNDKVSSDKSVRDDDPNHSYSYTVGEDGDISKTDEAKNVDS